MALDREKVLQSAQKYVEKRKYDKALVEYRRLIEVDPNDARTLLKMGDVQAKMGAFAETIATYELVGRLYASQGFALKAIAVYKQIREIISKHVPNLEERYAHITPKLAELYQQLGLLSDALATLDEMAVRLQRQQRDHEAIQVFHHIVQLDPTNPLPHLRLAEACSRIGDVDGAVYEFKVAASQLAALGRRDDALKVLERLLHHKVEIDQARMAAELYLSRGQPQDGMQALAKLQLCFQADQRDLDTLALLARAFNLIGQGRKAVEVQKEMARIARDTKRADLFKHLVSHLAQIAPQDDSVVQLMHQAASVPPMGPASVAPPSVEVRHSAAPAYSSRDAGGYGAPHSARGLEAHDSQIEYAETQMGVDEYDDVQEISADEIDYEDIEEVIEVDAAVAGATEPPSPYDADDLADRVRQLLGDATSFHRVGLFDKAIQAALEGLGLSPRSLDLRELLRDAYLDSGRTADAVQQMLSIAELYVDALDGDSAARTLQDVLAYDPRNARAIRVLEELGYEVVDEASDAAAPDLEDYVDPAGDLPSYDLDDGGDAVALSPRGPSRAPASVDSLDAPFDGALPSFPLDDGVDAGARPTKAPPRPSAAAAAHAPVGHEIEEALEESEFFVTRGLLEDARAILQGAVARYPSHPLLAERLADLERQIAAARASDGDLGPRSGRDQAFDIAASLDALEELDTYTGKAPAFGAQEQQVDVEEVFAKFKEGVAKQISVDDSQSHYDLGLAYKEMMLLDDAIREFEVAARDAARECVCWSMIGMVQLERGNINDAIDAFLKGLAAPQKLPEQEIALAYEVGSAYEARRRNSEALEYFQRVATANPDYRDVRERLERLTRGRTKPPLKAAGGDEEFDRAFDDLLGGGDS